MKKIVVLCCFLGMHNAYSMDLLKQGMQLIEQMQPEHKQLASTLISLIGKKDHVGVKDFIKTTDNATLSSIVQARNENGQGLLDLVKLLKTEEKKTVVQPLNTGRIERIVKGVAFLGAAVISLFKKIKSTNLSNPFSPTLIIPAYSVYQAWRNVQKAWYNTDANKTIAQTQILSRMLKDQLAVAGVIELKKKKSTNVDKPSAPSTQKA